MLRRVNGRLFGVIGGVVMAAAGLIVGLVPVNNGKGLSCGRPFSTSPYVNLCASMANHQALAWTLLVGGVLVAGLSVLISRARPAGQIDQAVQTQLQALDAAYTRGDLTLEAHDLAVRQIAQVS